MITPTVGRVMWFYPAMNDSHRNSDKPLAAIVSHVWSDTCVNLAIFTANGQAFGKTSVLLVQPESEVPSGGNYCCWMPYQQGQAAKTEALQKKLEEGKS